MIFPVALVVIDGTQQLANMERLRHPVRTLLEVHHQKRAGAFVNPMRSPSTREDPSVTFRKRAEVNESNPARGSSRQFENLLAAPHPLLSDFAWYR